MLILQYKGGLGTGLIGVLDKTLDNPNPFGTSDGDEFGNAIDIDGTNIIVGTRLEDELGQSNSGKAYIFNINGTLLHTLDNPNPYGTSGSDNFGQDVAISGTRAVVGAALEDDATGSSVGKVYIYNVSTGALLLTVDDPNAFGTTNADYFGWSVAIDGTNIIASATREDDASGTTSGKIYIIDVTTGNVLQTIDNPNAYNTSTGDQFGYSVAISGNRAISGAYLEDDVNGTTSGKAYIFNTDTGALLHTLDNPNPFGTGSTSDNFGYSVAMNGNRAVVGAYGEEFATGYNGGKVYVYAVDTGNLLYTIDNPNAYGTETNDGFGESVAVSESYIIAGAGNEDEVGQTNAGKAYIFDVTDGTLLFTLDNPNAEGVSANDKYATRVAISDSRAVVSAIGEESGAFTDSGRVYVFK